MRLISWNCRGGLSRKINDVLELHPDLAVLSEVQQKDLNDMPAGTAVAYAGPASKKGVAVIGWNGWNVQQTHPIEQKWFLPVTASRGSVLTHLLAIWAHRTTSYVEPTLSEINRLSHFLRAEDAMMVGDFNQSVSFDNKRRGNKRFAATLEQLASLGLSSAWHTGKNEPHGAETTPTHYFRYHSERRFHIDYAFFSERRMRMMTAVSLGAYADWVQTRKSDHVPLVIDFVDPP